MANSITLVGHVGQAPESRAVGDKDVVSFSVAEKQYQGRGKEPKTQWYSVKVWQDSTKKFCLDFVKKGDKVTVIGSLKSFAKNNGETGLEINATTVEGRQQERDRQSSAGAPRDTDHQSHGSPDGYGDGGGSATGGDADENIPFSPTFW